MIGLCLLDVDVTIYLSQILESELSYLLNKMPDAFEGAYPLSPSLTPQEIRARSNSSSNRKPVVAFFGDEIVEIPDKSIAGVDKPLSRSDLVIDSEIIPIMHNTCFDRRQLEHRCVNCQVT